MGIGAHYFLNTPRRVLRPAGVASYPRSPLPTPPNPSFHTDEAGRGPVLGPMVYGAAFCAKSASEYLASLGFHDSKQLTEETRAQLFASLQNDKRLGHVVDSLSAQLISSKVRWGKGKG